ncbi:related to nik-1 protein (Os-1p protein) [Fusarium torulosum]|uniref:Related to nik-1 protein (Os-1p protein) n=1 Tax=Fusarium torulosum TaxID=33205 RepID=A0AAE8LXK7_9HYPO|nr:related to nik-1 protein (Os-1p protein) [Fusarium torulosum]
MPCSAWRQAELSRERETFRYDPALIANSISNSPTNLIPSHKLTTSTDATLTTFCQLAALRLNTSRALISLFDRASQFVVAEATQHVRLRPNSSSKRNDEGLWLCGTNFPRSFGVCERVVLDCTNPTSSVNPASHCLPLTIIDDLANDETLCHRPYCHSWPNNRFYAGIPLITPRGIVIGVLCVFDSQPRSGLDEASENLLRDLAESVMAHLDERRVSERYRQADRVTRGIRRFFHGRSTETQIKDDQLLAAEPRLRTPGAGFSPQYNYSSDNRHRGDRLASTCASASSIMRDALEVDGLLLLDARNAHRSHLGNPQMDIDDLCPVLGSSVAAEAKQDSNSYFGHSTLYTSILKKLLRHYPRGTIWTFDNAEGDASDVLSDDSLSGASNQGPVIEEADETSPESPDDENVSVQTRQELRKVVNQLLPGAVSVAFFPIWNAQKRRWFAGGFAYSNRSSRVFSPKRELSYLRALGTVLMAEVSFIKEREVELSKLNVLDSISHELRSPLHGIFFGAGVLRSGDLNPSQDDALLSVEACSRTLLDTIDQILDWSKINHFTSSLAKGDYTYTDIDSRALRSSRNNSVEAGMMSIASDVDLPRLIEEVVESVHVGHEFQKLTLGQTAQGSDVSKDQVTVLINIEPMENWRFHVQPGAIRRIVMNVLGNSLRFTSRGSVHVQVEQAPTDDPSKRLVKLTIADTGCGMSRDFLTNDLFSPFTQQNIMSAGTGLGLSIVRRITEAMGGTVEVQSAPSVGTTVCMSLPLKLSGAPDRANIVNALARHDSEHNIEGSTVSISGFQDSVDNLCNPFLKNQLGEKEIVLSMCRDWLKLRIVETQDGLAEAPHVVLCDDQSLDRARTLTQDNQSIPIVVICHNAVVARKKEAAEARSGTEGEQQVLFTHQPIGPRKLAKILSRFVNEHTTETQPPSAHDPAAPNTETQSSPSLTIRQAPPTPPTGDDETITLLNNPFFNRTIPQLPRSPLITPLEKSNPISDESSSQNNTFLLVDDNPINLKMLVMFMKKLKLQYVVATDGQKAVAKYRENPKSYKCVFMDISMPVMNGFEATRAIRAIEAEGAGPRCSIFALTGLASRDAQQEALLSGIDLFLTKPIALAEITHILESKGFL